jgi:hypothetical protein
MEWRQPRKERADKSGGEDGERRGALGPGDVFVQSLGWESALLERMHSTRYRASHGSFGAVHVGADRSALESGAGSSALFGRDGHVRLTYESGARELRAYCNAIYAGDADFRRSTTGYVFVMHGGAVSWSRRLQPIVAASTMEAEYMGAAVAVKEALWSKKLAGDIKVGIVRATRTPKTFQCSMRTAAQRKAQ